MSERAAAAAALFDEGYIRRFRARRASISCTELLGADLSSPEGFAQAKADDVFAGTCPDCVRIASEILVDMLRERGVPR